MEFNGNHKIKSMKLLFKREQKTRLQRLLFIITRKLMSLQNEADPVQNTNYYGSSENIEKSDIENKPTIIEFNPWIFSEEDSMGEHFFNEIGSLSVVVVG